MIGLELSSGLVANVEWITGVEWKTEMKWPTRVMYNAGVEWIIRAE